MNIFCKFRKKSPEFFIFVVNQFLTGYETYSDTHFIGADSGIGFSK